MSRARAVSTASTAMGPRSTPRFGWPTSTASRWDRGRSSTRLHWSFTSLTPPSRGRNASANYFVVTVTDPQGQKEGEERSDEGGKCQPHCVAAVRELARGNPRINDHLLSEHAFKL